jgi:hypothetical protein
MHLQGKRHKAALAALLAADPEAAVPGYSFRVPSVSTAPSPAADVVSATPATPAQDNSGSNTSAAPAKAVPAYDPHWKPPSGARYACRACRFAGTSNDAEHFKARCVHHENRRTVCSSACCTSYTGALPEACCTHTAGMCTLQSRGHMEACLALMSQGLTVCQPCGMVCPDVEAMRDTHCPGRPHQSRVAWLNSSAAFLLPNLHPMLACLSEC